MAPVQVTLDRGEHWWGRARPPPPPSGDGLTPSLTIMLAIAKF